MKTRYYLTLIFISVAFLSCNRSADPDIAPETNSTFTLTVNGDQFYEFDGDRLMFIPLNKYGNYSNFEVTTLSNEDYDDEVKFVHRIYGDYEVGKTYTDMSYFDYKVWIDNESFYYGGYETEIQNMSLRFEVITQNNLKGTIDISLIHNGQPETHHLEFDLEGRMFEEYDAPGDNSDDDNDDDNDGSGGNTGNEKIPVQFVLDKYYASGTTDLSCLLPINIEVYEGVDVGFNYCLYSDPNCRSCGTSFKGFYGGSGASYGVQTIRAAVDDDEGLACGASNVATFELSEGRYTFEWESTFCIYNSQTNEYHKYINYGGDLSITRADIAEGCKTYFVGLNNSIHQDYRSYVFENCN